MSHPDLSPPARIAPLEPPYEPETAEMLARWMPPGSDIEPLALFRTLAVHPQLSARMRPLGAAILGRSATVPIELRELMIDRTCAVTEAEYEWGVHAAAFGAAAGLDEARLQATVRADSRSPGWTEPQSAVIELADQLHATSAVDDELWTRLGALFSHQQILELIVTAGWYHVIAYVCNGLRVEREPWAMRFPS